MEKIVTNYTINSNTMALLPAKNIEYDTIVIEQSRRLFVRKTPLELIKLACLAEFCTYEGIRCAVMHHTGWQKKVPIPINKNKSIYAFPTHAPTHFRCAWIFSNHVMEIKRRHSIEKPTIQSVITFKNGEHLDMNESYHILEKQMHRTNMCLLRFPSRLSGPMFHQEMGVGMKELYYGKEFMDDSDLELK
ncbi:competence protein [Virgibacillus phasianinus]|uniref:Competence protein n=1 Tax=Virgibacillus phasianinus TaxID=2017483 RepID=A0A220U2T2_9BACI|nr:competence protein ComK [Virgibacillus phasianinus]ASK62292.1 competence protein [Virgibacillus phasianinus]